MKKCIKICSIMLTLILLCGMFCSCKKEGMNIIVSGDGNNMLECNTASTDGENVSTNLSEATQTSASNNLGSNSEKIYKSNYIWGDPIYGFESEGDKSLVSGGRDNYNGSYYNIDGLWNIFMLSEIDSNHENGEYSYNVHKNGFVEIVKVLSQKDEIVMPTEIDGKKVAYIGKNAFLNKNVKKIVLPNGILAVGDSAFSELEELEYVSLPESLMVICEDAFYNCGKLKDVYFPENLRAIGERAFQNCDSIENVKFPNELALVSSDAFSNCSNLKNVSFGKGILGIGSGAFERTAIVEVVIPDKVYSMSAGVFSGCVQLKEAVIPKTVGDKENGFGWGMFMGCVNLETVNIPENIIGLPSDIFRGCKLLKSITIPASIESLGSDVFDGCTSLKDIYFESKDCTLYYNSFLFNTGLTVHAPRGGSVEKFFRFRPLVKFVATD